MRRKPLTKRGYDRTRTGDLGICNPSLYQLSYAPIGTESFVNRPDIHENIALSVAPMSRGRKNGSLPDTVVISNLERLNRGRLKSHASCWARTSDLSVNSRALYQLSQGGI